MLDFLVPVSSIFVSYSFNTCESELKIMYFLPGASRYISCRNAYCRTLGFLLASSATTDSPVHITYWPWCQNPRTCTSLCRLAVKKYCSYVHASASGNLKVIEFRHKTIVRIPPSFWSKKYHLNQARIVQVNLYSDSNIWDSKHETSADKVTIPFQKSRMKKAFTETIILVTSKTKIGSFTRDGRLH